MQNLIGNRLHFIRSQRHPAAGAAQCIVVQITELGHQLQQLTPGLKAHDAQPAPFLHQF